MGLMRKLSKTPEYIKNIYPSFIVRKMLEMDENPEINDKPNTKITDFLRIYIEIWRISNRDYQERFWVKQELPMKGDTFSETTMTFEDTAEGILDPDASIQMTKKQRAMLTQLFHLVGDYKNDPDTPRSRYGEKDDEIVNDPRWDKIRNYAKEVYDELTKED
jgi:hypothetical protein